MLREHSVDINSASALNASSVYVSDTNKKATECKMKCASGHYRKEITQQYTEQNATHTTEREIRKALEDTKDHFFFTSDIH